MPSTASALAPRTEWAARICAAYGRSIEAILDVGRELIAAKEALPHGEFQSMIRRDLPFGERMAQMYMRVARHRVLSNAKYTSHLPPSISTLYELSKLEPDELMPILRRLEKKKVDDDGFSIAALLLARDVAQVKERPRVTVQAVQERVSRMAAPHVEPREEAPPWEEVPTGELQFPKAAERIPRPPVSTVTPRDAPPVDIALERLKAAWLAAGEESRRAFLEWVR